MPTNQVTVPLAIQKSLLRTKKPSRAERYIMGLMVMCPTCKDIFSGTPCKNIDGREPCKKRVESARHWMDSNVSAEAIIKLDEVMRSRGK